MGKFTNCQISKYKNTWEMKHAVRTPKHIYFTEHTKCDKASSQGLQVEKYAFDFCAYPEISKEAEDNRFLIGK